MFDHFAWSVAVVPVLVVVLTLPLARRLSPSVGAAVLAWSAVVAACASLVNLGLFAVKAVAEIPAVAERFGWSHRVVAEDTAHVPWVSWVSAAWLVWSVAAVARVRRRHRRGHRIAEEFAHLPADRQVVVVESDAVDAYAVPGRPGRIVVTTAMREALTPEQYAALLAHERAHLDAGHPRLIMLAESAGAAHPALRWVARRVGYLIERAADEAAAVAVGDRRTVARAIGTAALASVHAPGPAVPVATSFARSRKRPGAIPSRVAALLVPGGPGLTKWVGLLPALAAVSSAAWTGEALLDFCQLLHGAAVGSR
ncbi:M56 family metallopeptidase [Yinghuangia sp. ASG 101]|uniref:M56 family metallopeptidase n=1 Tax=Yinghuangia sp. ASG 101 TaxID=2896848 RepID=UPI001E5C0B0D|nr:M56 family metallopeptidase [Yinghuangia sp. ASG 101]UGQ13463.1 M56 family metallopeptidase [Yinghuangia sp. ASG 101]